MSDAPRKTSAFACCGVCSAVHRLPEGWGKVICDRNGVRCIGCDGQPAARPVRPAAPSQAALDFGGGQ